MAEVFTISGADPVVGYSNGHNGHNGHSGYAGWGQAAAAASAAASCPAGWARTPAGNCSAPGGKPAPAAIKLQNALKTLGSMVKDPVLANVRIDGVIGPATVAAFNKASAAHIATATAYVWSLNQVASNADAFAGVVETEIKRRGGTVPAAPPVVAVTPRRRTPPARIPGPTPVPEKKGVPTAVWVVAGIAGAVAVTGILVLTLRKKPVPKPARRGLQPITV